MRSTVAEAVGDVFVDTNVLIYARDRRNEEKRERARLWLAALSDAGRARLNLQVLNELTRWVLANEPKRPVMEVRAEVDALRVWGDRPTDEDEIELAWEVRARLGYGWFDCLLVAAACASGCAIFLTEDLGDRARFGDLTIVNPFRTSPDAVLRPN